MKSQIIVLLSLVALTLFGCAKKDKADEAAINNTSNVGELYFPEIDTAEWQTIPVQESGWNQNEIAPLYQLLEDKNTKAFLILKDGKIVLERYFGSFTESSIWYWASAGKTLTSFTVGIAQEQGLLNLNDSTADHLGEGWTSLTSEQENKITIRNQLTMTSGLRNDLPVFSCTDPDCLTYDTAPNTRWSYHNAPYTLLQDVIGNAANTPFTTYFNTQLRDRIGMDGMWIGNGDNSVFYSTARSMARFGLLNLANGRWKGDSILRDDDYLYDMKTKSQNLNESYGYLWWLNGESSYMGTKTQEVFQGALLPNAPSDTYMALGKNDQKLYIVPSKGMVIVRLGEDAGENQLGPSSFDSQLWDKIAALIN